MHKQNGGISACNYVTQKSSVLIFIKNLSYLLIAYTLRKGRLRGLVVEHRTLERERSGVRSSLRSPVMSLSKIHLPPKKYW